MGDFGNKYALVGNGYIGNRHMDAIGQVGGETILICDIDPKRKVDGIGFMENWQSMESYPHWDEIGTVVVATPNDLHVPIAKWAAARGKRVLVEKPMAIRSCDVLSLGGLKNVYAVMQLRHHHLFRQIMETPCKRMSVLASVRRDASYWEGWKGDRARSGGIAFNLGVHYFDVMVQKFGHANLPCQPVTEVNERNLVVGHVKPLNMAGRVDFKIEITPDGAGQERSVTLDGERFVFSDKDNLSMENLHVKVYEDMEEGRGVTPNDLYDLTRFIEKIC